MFETGQFRDQLAQVIASETGKTGLAQYETSVVQYLQNLAIENESFLMERELKKAAGRRGVQEALASASLLVQEACRYASLEKETILRLPDIQKAYAAKFCQVWPFCK